MNDYRNSSLNASARADALLSLMTVEEKIGQLCKLDGFRSYVRKGAAIEITPDFQDKFAQVPIGSMYGLLRADWWTEKSWDTGIEPRHMRNTVNLFQKYAVEHTRFGIPLLLAEEAPHGLMVLGGTVFPSGLGMGATWNPALMKKAAEVIGAEAAAAGIHTVYGPILDMARDPRWSRTEEDFSEDPALTSAMGKAYVEGLQGDVFPSAGRPFATLKHFAGHGDPEGGHNGGPSHVGPVEMRNVQLRPFETCIRAGARSLMCAYNTVDLIPCAGNRRLLTDFLRGELQFDGFVVSDRGAIPNLLHQRFAADAAGACARALKAGIDTDEGFIDFYAAGLHEALDRGLIAMADLDQAVKRVLILKFRMGLFERPFVYDGKAAEIIGGADHRQTALQMARESLILLSNKSSALPLTGIKKIAVLGPNADTPMNQLGDYTAPQKRAGIVTVYDGMKALAATHGAEIRYAKGCKVRSSRRDMLTDALETARWADAVVLVLGGSSAAESDSGFLENGASRIQEVMENSEFDKDCGEGYDRAKLRLGGLQLELLSELHKLGKRIITVLIMGRPMIIDKVVELSDSVLLGWYPGMMGGQAVAEAVFGDLNPGGKLPISFPRDEAQIPVFYNIFSRRGDYIDLAGAPLFSFGFGLSYTTFEFSELTLDRNRIKPDENLTVSIKIKNTGKIAGDEVAQLYLTAHNSSVARPWRELKAFRRLHLAPNESTVVTFTLSPQELGVFNEDLKWQVEPGRFTVCVGENLESHLEAEFHVDCSNLR